MVEMCNDACESIVRQRFCVYGYPALETRYVRDPRITGVAVKPLKKASNGKKTVHRSTTGSKNVKTAQITLPISSDTEYQFWE